VFGFTCAMLVGAGCYLVAAFTSRVFDTRHDPAI